MAVASGRSLDCVRGDVGEKVMYVKGLGQTDCGANPCGWFDNVWLSDACQSYLGCADPTNPLYVTATKGLIVGGAQVLGQTAADATVAATGIPLWAWAVGAGALALYILPSLVKR